MAGLHICLCDVLWNFMKKQCYFIAAMILGIFSTVSSAATQRFWATTTQSDTAWDPTFLSEGSSKTFDINYNLGSDWTINSAKLWLLAVDDYNGNHCSSQGGTSANCNDDSLSNTAQDPSEQAKIVTIEGIPGIYGSPLEINSFKWYDLNINVASYLSNADGRFTATVKASLGDFWYKPVPAAIWLFGSALLGLTCLKRKPTIAG